MHGGGTKVIVYLLGFEGVTICLMQSLNEWQKYKLVKAGIHHNIHLNPTELSHSGNHFNTGLNEKNEKKEEIVETRNFAFILIALCFLVIMYRFVIFTF